jgi:hypothetical protein
VTKVAPIGMGLMCKPPRAGQSKTRLAAGVGPEAAAMLARAFLADTAATVSRAAEPAHLVKMAFHRPADAGDEIGAVIGADWPLVFCDAGDLGASMWWALTQLLRVAPAGALVIGADLPTLPDALILDAAARLRAGGESTVVVGPSADGGYWLIGVRGEAAAPLFAPMAWSTPGVMAETRRRAAANGLDLVETGLWRDVDEAADLAEVEGAAAPASETRAALAALRAAGMLPG